VEQEVEVKVEERHRGEAEEWSRRGRCASPRCPSRSVASSAASASTAGAASPSPKVEVGRGAKMWCASTPPNISECMPLTGSHTWLGLPLGLRFGFGFGFGFGTPPLRRRCRHGSRHAP